MKQESRTNINRVKKDISSPDSFTPPEELKRQLITTMQSIYDEEDIEAVERAYKVAYKAHENIDSIKNGIVLDHIRAGRGMQIYNSLGLDQLDCSVAIIKNVKSNKMGKKDIIKISDAFEVNFDVLGYIDPEVTVCVIENGSVKSKHKVELPEKIVNIARCKNPRCITSVEQEIDHVFKLTDREHQVYRCIYCESKLKK